MLLLILIIGGGMVGWLVSRRMPPSAQDITRVVINIVLGSVISCLVLFLITSILNFLGVKRTDTLMIVLVLVSWGITFWILTRIHLRVPSIRPLSNPGTMTRPRGVHIFISYRREDTGGYAGRIFDRLSQLVGRERVFMDIDTIEPGIDFADAIQQAVRACDILLVLIGPTWLRITDASGHRRLDNPEDFVRLEIVTALERDIRIIPVLVEETKMPDADDLPEPLKRLTRRNALQISNTRWSYDIERIIDIVKRVVPRSST